MRHNLPSHRSGRGSCGRGSCGLLSRVSRRCQWLLLLTLLAACAAPAPPPTPAPPTLQPTMVALRFGASSFERSAYQPLLTRFAADNPDVRVQFVTLDRAIEQGISAVASSVDVALVPGGLLASEPQATALLRDLRPFIDADASFARSDFLPGALPTDPANGTMTAIPSTLAPRLLFYNRDLFARQGLAEPALDWSWADVLAAATHLTNRSGSNPTYGFAGADGRTVEVLVSTLDAAGIDLTGPIDQIDLANPAVASALAQVQALIQSGAVYQPPAAAQPAAPQLADLIRRGQVAIWAGDLPGATGNLPFAVGVARMPPLPLPNDPPAQVYLISQGSAAPDAAWRLLAFLSRQAVPAAPPGLARLAAIPARQSHLMQASFWPQFAQETGISTAEAVVLAQLRQAAPLRSVDWRVMAALEGVLAQPGRPLAQALAGAQQQLQHYRANAAAATATPVVAPPVVPAAARAVPAGATLVRFGTPLRDPTALEALAQRFNQAQDAIAVEIVPFAFPSGQVVTLDAVATTVDCLAWPGIPQPLPTAALADLQPLIDADASFALAEYPAALLAPLRQNGALYGLPDQVAFQALYYDQAAFDAVGLAYPSADWTMHDLLANAQQLTGGEGSARRYGFASVGWAPGDVLFTLARFGASGLRAGTTPADPAFSDPQVLAALRLYVELLQTASPHQSLGSYGRGMDGDAAAQLVAEGRVAMWFGTLADPPEATSSMRLAVAPPPLGGSQVLPGDVDASGLYIAAQTPHTPQCWEWLKFLSANLVQPAAGSFPARRTVAESAAFRSQVPPGFDAVYAAYRAALDRTPTTGAASTPAVQLSALAPEVDAFWLLRAVDRAIQGQNLERELAAAEDLTRTYLACYHTRATWRACAREADPQYQGWALP